MKPHDNFLSPAALFFVSKGPKYSLFVDYKLAKKKLKRDFKTGFPKIFVNKNAIKREKSGGRGSKSEHF